MLSSISTTRTGQYAETIDGLGAGGQSGLPALRDERANAAALGQAIRDALQSARDQGLGAFAPDTGTLQVPTVPLAELRDLFTSVLRVPYCSADQTPDLPDYGALSLEQWSQAEATLAIRVARDDSMLPPANGGGPQYARGFWYVNGEPYTTAELFLTLRMGTLGNLDRQLADNLNILSANTELARELMAVLAEMKRRTQMRTADALAAGTSDNITFIPNDDFAAFVEAAGLTVARIGELAAQLPGGRTNLTTLSQLAEKNAATAEAGDYIGAMGELQSMFDGINSDNDIVKLRVDSLHNARLNMLVGVSDYLSSARAQSRTVGRNL